MSLASEAAQWASEIMPGSGEFFLCRHRTCLPVCRSVEWPPPTRTAGDTTGAPTAASSSAPGRSSPATSRPTRSGPRRRCPTSTSAPPRRRSTRL
eukprot:15446652-Alexandrium_andersonii.AAC.1